MYQHRRTAAVHTFVFFIAHIAAQQLPYNPTRILLSSDNRTAYIFAPSNGTTGQYRLLSLDLTQEIAAGASSATTLSSDLAFIQTINATTIIPYTDNDGGIWIWAGNCELAASQSKLFKMVSSSTAANSGVTWHETPISRTGTSLQGPAYLTSGISFQSTIGQTASNPAFYAFGGMCPKSTTASSSASAQAMATYSADIQQLAPVDDKDAFTLQTSAAAKGAPIAQAGQTMTGLIPSYTNQTDGSRSVKQDFVMVGGHTAKAFVNMSNIAVYSLPQATWSYVPVTTASDVIKTELVKIKAASSEVQPRSGHTAVLSSDGSKIIVYGGWVGDTSTPASPQLVSLDVGAGSGGSGSWQWTVIEPPSSSIPSTDGIYGHAAAILPADIMMIVGGRQISAAATKQKHKRATTSGDLQIRFFNTTSNSWVDKYNTGGTSNRAVKSADNSSQFGTTQKVGLAIGLIVAVILLILGALAYRKYKKRHREHWEGRQGEIDSPRSGILQTRTINWQTTPYLGGQMALAHEAQPMMYPKPTRKSVDTYAPTYGEFQQWDPHAATRTGVQVEVPSPTRGLRRNVSGGYGPSTYEPRACDPILEVSETRPPSLEQRKVTPPRITLTDRASNPFVDPEPESVAYNPLAQHPISQPVVRPSMPYNPFPSFWDVMPKMMPSASTLKPYDATATYQPRSQQDRLLSPPIDSAISPSCYSPRTMSMKSSGTVLSRNKSPALSHDENVSTVSGLARALSYHSAAVLRALGSSQELLESTAKAAAGYRPANLVETYAADVHDREMGENPFADEAAIRPLSIMSPPANIAERNRAHLETVPESPRPLSQLITDPHILQKNVPTWPMTHIPASTSPTKSQGSDHPALPRSAPSVVSRTSSRSPVKSMHSAGTRSLTSNPGGPGRSTSNSSTPSILSSVRRALGVDRNPEHTKTAENDRTFSFNTIASPYSPTRTRDRTSFSTEPSSNNFSPPAIASLPSQQPQTTSQHQRSTSDTVTASYASRLWSLARRKPSTSIARSPGSINSNVSDRIAMFEHKEQEARSAKSSPSKGTQNPFETGPFAPAEDIETEIEKLAIEKRVVVAGAYMRPRETLRVVNAEDEDGVRRSVSGGSSRSRHERALRRQREKDEWTVW